MGKQFFLFTPNNKQRWTEVTEAVFNSQKETFSISPDAVNDKIAGFIGQGVYHGRAYMTAGMIKGRKAA